MESGLNSPGSYVHWNVFVLSDANLALIIAMLVIFVAAIALPFPGDREINPEQVGGEEEPISASGPAPTTWTGRARAWTLRKLPPDRLLPEKQPGYVASWVYVFGVGSLAALAMAIVSGFAIALGGVHWWHTNPVGHFLNSMHLWSVEMFMAFMVIHLWAKFFMSAWRGGRARTWITGVLAFMASVVEAFTGYLSQSNFDSQWISTSGKDAFNAVGVGGFFNLMNSGQMLLWHVVLMPIILVALIGIHVLFVRYRGVVHPFPAQSGRDALGSRIEGPAAHLSASEEAAADAKEWRGPYRRYDIIREGVAAIAVVSVVVLALAGGLSSPDLSSATIQNWASSDPGDFLATAASEMLPASADGASETVTYGPPYNNANGSTQRIIISWQKLVGVRQKIDAAQTFVVGPLTAFAVTDPPLAAALRTYKSASSTQQQTWVTNYSNALAKATTSGSQVNVPPGDYGPVTLMLASELNLARSGGLDASLVANKPFYGTNYTRPLLFLEDGSYFGAIAQAQHLQGNQWGVMNETGSYPGQPWLWLYQLWYQLPGFRSSANVDLIAIYLTGLATVVLALLPFIPGLRQLPRKTRVYRLIWRPYYRDAEGTVVIAADSPGPAPQAEDSPAQTT
jgi:hypothetical protein